VVSCGRAGVDSIAIYFAVECSRHQQQEMEGPTTPSLIAAVRQPIVDGLTLEKRDRVLLAAVRL